MTSESSNQPPKRLHILVVEDNWLLANTVQDLMRSEGVEVVGPAATLDQAQALARGNSFDAALLDINLRGEKVFPVADTLAERDIPFAFVTGYELNALPVEHRERPVFAKPYDDRLITRFLASVGLSPPQP